MNDEAEINGSVRIGEWWHVARRKSGVWFLWGENDIGDRAWVDASKPLSGWRRATADEVREIEAARGDAV